MITDISGPRHQYTVTTRERFAVQRDPAGIRLSDPQHVSVEYSYDVVPHDDGWAILWWNDTGICGDWSAVVTKSRRADCGSADFS